jgi:antitoxin (DNA-binding transcriptional repressor) of toxin-antitoxin stability system
MDISVTDFKHRCLQVVRRVERTRQGVAITRRGKVVAHLEPSSREGGNAETPWERLRALGGSLRAAPGASVVSDEDFEALR